MEECGTSIVRVAGLSHREWPELDFDRLGDDPSDYNIGEDVEPCDGTGKAIKTIAAVWGLLHLLVTG